MLTGGTKTGRRFFGLAMLIVLLVAVGPAQGEQRFSGCDPMGVVTSTSEWTRAFSEYLNAHGFQIKIYPITALGSFDETSDLMRQGLLEYCACGPFPLFKSAPVVFGGLLPYSFGDMDHYRRFIRSKGGLIDKVNQTSPKTGIRLLDWVVMSGPIGIFTVKKPVRALEDFKGLRLRFLAPPQKVLYEALGAKGVGIPWPEVYTSLQTGMIDGYAHAPQVALMFRHNEVFKYFTRLDLGYVTMPMTVSEAYYQKLSPEQKKVLSQAVAAGRQANDAWIKANVPGNLKRLQESGVEIITPSPGEAAKIKAKIMTARAKMAPPPVVEFWARGAERFK